MIFTYFPRKEVTDMSQNVKRWVRVGYYALVCAALAVAAILLMWQCVAIYRVGDSPFTRERIAEYFAPIAVPVYICIGLVVAGFALSPLLPATPDSKPDRDAVTLRRLQEKAVAALPDEQARLVSRLRRSRMLHHNITLSLLAIGTAVFLWYALDVERFPLQDATGAMVNAMWVLLPCVGVPFLYAVFTAYFCRNSVRKEIAVLRTAQYRRLTGEMERHDELNSETTVSGEFGKNKKAKTSNSEVWVSVVRGVVLAAAIGLTVYGLLYNGAMDVLWKAVNICQECIGLG